METDISCPICEPGRCTKAYSGKALRNAWQDGTDWEVWRCAFCGHGVLHPQPAAETLASYYDKGYAPYSAEHGLSAEMEQTIATARARGDYRNVIISPGMRLLDVGAGGGSFLRVASAMGADVQGVEPSEHGVASCRAQGLSVFHGTLTDFLESDPGSFDLITANHVVEHHPNPVEFLSEMKQLLAPGGTIWISVPNAGCFFSRALKDIWHSTDLPVHLHHFTAESLGKVFERAGLRNVAIRSESENSLPLSLSVLLRRRALIPSRLTLALTRSALSKTGVLGQRIDAAGHGEALMAEAHI